MPKSIIIRIQTPMFEWYVGSCGFKNRHSKDMCLKESGLHAQTMLTIPDSTMNMIGGHMYDYSMSTRIFTLITNKIFI